jgi:serine/threonine protein kinase/Tfp pilus assembly protein PilF
MGAVWRAHDPDLNRELAIKILMVQGRVDLKRRFLEEAQVTGQLQHPGIPPIHEIGRLEDGRRFFAMKLIEGRTLDALLKERKSPVEELPRFLSIFGQVCQTLGFAHSRGVIHRNLKPCNVMVGAFGEVQVMDWGLAKPLGREDRALRPEGRQAPERHAEPSAIHAPQFPVEQTQAGSVLGTPAFMAPEQARGEIGQLDERCDVFGLGAILCVILTGSPPFRGSDAQSYVKQASQGNVADAYSRLESCTADKELIELARRCLDAQRERRPRQAGEVAAGVEAYQAGVQERLRRAELERARAEIKSAEERKRQRLAIGLAVTVIALLLLGGLAVWRSERQKTERRAEQARQEAEKREATARQEERTGLQIKIALDQAAALQKRAMWAQGREVLQQAMRLLDEDDSAALRQGITAAMDQLKLVERLDTIRQEKAIGVGRSLNHRAAPGKYQKALKEAGFDVHTSNRDEVARRIRQSSIKDEIIAALEDWEAFQQNGELIAKLWLLTADVTGEKWRTQLADPNVRNNRAALEKMLSTTVQERMSATSLATVGEMLHFQRGKGIAILIQAQRRLPSDFWLNFTLGNLSRDVPEEKEKVLGHYMAALAVRRDNAAVYMNLGTFLTREKRDLGGALFAYRRAVDIDPKQALAQFNLGVTQLETGNLDGAIMSFQKALELDETDVMFHVGLAGALLERFELDGALHHCKRAVELDETREQAWNNLGAVLLLRDEPAAAVEAYRKALKRDENSVRARTGLGRALLRVGQFTDARKELERSLKETPRTHPGHSLASRSLQQVETYLRLEPQLATVLAGQPLTGPAEVQLTVAELCLSYRNRPLAAVRLYSKVFKDDPEWMNNVPRGHRREAARAALLVSCGIGADAGGIDNRERIRLRTQALTWMQAEVLALENARQSGKPQFQLREILSGLSRNGSFHSVRVAEQLSKLTEAERAAWRKVWTDIDTILQQSFSKGAPSKLALPDETGKP